MAIQTTYTDAGTGEISPQAHVIVHNPVMREDTRQVVLRVSLYASKADYDAGRSPVREFNRTLDTGYAALRTAILNLAEPAIITRFFPGGTRVPD